jgi:hypothetical protein
MPYWLAIRLLNLHVIGTVTIAGLTHDPEYHNLAFITPASDCLEPSAKLIRAQVPATARVTHQRRCIHKTIRYSSF